MLLAPFTLTEISKHQRRSAPVPTLRVPPWLLIWVITGLLATCLIPAFRGDAMTGMSIPFWMVGAPLLDILWLTRRRWSAALRGRRC